MPFDVHALYLKQVFFIKLVIKILIKAILATVRNFQDNFFQFMYKIFHYENWKHTLHCFI